MSPVDPHRQQILYWRELGELTTAFCYYKLLRNRLGRLSRTVGVIKAIATSGTIAAWVIWQQAALVWAAIIAASQLLDAVKDEIPFQKNHRSSSDLVTTLDYLLIDAQFEWETIFAGRVANDEIADRCRKLMRSRTKPSISIFRADMSQISGFSSWRKQKQGPIYQADMAQGN